MGTTYTTTVAQTASQSWIVLFVLVFFALSESVGV